VTLLAEENRLRTVAGLSSLWDAAPIRRVRAGDGASILPGRRLALHLMAQPDAAARMLSDEVLLDQGFLSRLLVASPASTAGTRFQRELRPETEPALRRYGARLLDILETPPILMAGVRNALDPRRLEFDDEARSRGPRGIQVTNRSRLGYFGPPLWTRRHFCCRSALVAVSRGPARL
jgi:Protein of unknown function (DUF3987)